MEAIPEIDLDLLRHTLHYVVTDGLGILCEKLVKVEASHALNVNVLVRLLVEEISANSPERFLSIRNSSDEKTTISESELNANFYVICIFLLVFQEFVKLFTSSMDIFEAFFYFDVDAEVEVSSVIIFIDELLRSTDSSLQVGNVLLVALS